jgi:hypothetical protein
MAQISTTAAYPRRSGPRNASTRLLVTGADISRRVSRNLRSIVVLSGEGVAAVGVHAHVGRLPGRLGGQELRHVGFSTAAMPGR